MANRSVARHAVLLALLLGTAFFPLASPAAPKNSSPTQAPSLVPPGLMLAKNWPAGQDPLGYLVSEKLDGVRAFWDGRTLRFRSGRQIAAPRWFTDALPSTPLDGELWLGRQNFDRLSGIVRRNAPVDAEWHELRYMIFDLPGQPGRFDERAARIGVMLETAGVPWLQAAEQLRVPDRETLQLKLQELTDGGGEGFVLHRADAEWKPGRSNALYKLKPQPDEDARVVAYQPGKGRLKDSMGALVLEMPNGQRFALGTGFTDAQRVAPPKLGSLVTYRYSDRTPTGLPRFASFLRVREAE
jgi:DNA ligase-1